MPRDDFVPSNDGVGPGPSTPPVGLVGRLLGLLLSGMPLIFGVGFIAPLITQLLKRGYPEAAQTQWPLLAGLTIGASWGALATLRGRWL